MLANSSTNVIIQNVTFTTFYELILFSITCNFLYIGRLLFFLRLIRYLSVVTGLMLNSKWWTLLKVLVSLSWTEAPSEQLLS